MTSGNKQRALESQRPIIKLQNRDAPHMWTGKTNFTRLAGHEGQTASSTDQQTQILADRHIGCMPIITKKVIHHRNWAGCKSSITQKWHILKIKLNKLIHIF